MYRHYSIHIWPQLQPTMSGNMATTSTTARYIMREVCGIFSHWFYHSSAEGSKVRGGILRGVLFGKYQIRRGHFLCAGASGFFCIMRGLRETTPDRSPDHDNISIYPSLLSAPKASKWMMFRMCSKNACSGAVIFGLNWAATARGGLIL